MMIVIPAGTSPLAQAIVRAAQSDIPILENPVGSNRSPEIDAMCKEFGVPLASYWCALWTSHVWKKAGAEIPPVNDAKAWHPALCETWRQWAFQTGRFSTKPELGYAVLYDHNGDGKADHIGCCVVSVQPILLDFEGNTSETGFSREGELTEMKRVDVARLIGYVSPVPFGASMGIAA